MQRRLSVIVIIAGALALFIPSGFGFPFHHKKYETPITKDTLQPDKILFDRAIKNIEHGNYEAARLTLQTLINTYDTSEYLAKAKLAIADSWFREGGAHGLAQAEAEYKDFILFYPNMEEAAESQYKICNIHFKQMEKADRDSAQGQRAEDECRHVMEQFPNSKFVPQAQQMLRDVQETLADKEFLTGDFYHRRGSFPAAASRLTFVTSQYPLYSGVDEALWELADSYKHMGDRFETKETDALTKLVRDYPLSPHVGVAKEMLTAMKQPVPQADPMAYARMKYEIENRKRPGMVHRAMEPFESHPDTWLAAKTGDPSMKSLRPVVPDSVPDTAAGGQKGVSDVSATQVVSNTDAIDKAPDVRLSASAATTPAPAAQPASLNPTARPSDQLQDAADKPATQEALPTNHPPTKQQLKLMKKAQEKAAKEAKKNAGKKPANTAQPVNSTQPANAAQPATAGQTSTIAQPNTPQAPAQ